MCSFLRSRAFLRLSSTVLLAALLLLLSTVVGLNAYRGLPLLALKATDENSIMLPVVLKPPLEPTCGDVVEFGGTISQNTILDPSKTYVINNSITVSADVTLQILPGTVLKFAPGRGIHVIGKLVANGEPANPVYFSTYEDDTLCGDTNLDGSASSPSAGDWGWIHFTPESDHNSSIRNAVIRYGGRQGNSWRAPIRIQNISPTLEFISFEHNHRNAVQIIGGNWTSNVLSSTSVIYWLYDNHLSVLPGNTLTIAPGVKIKPARGHGFSVEGTLNAVGNESQPIVITSEFDDTVCGAGVSGESICDTTNDSTSTNPEDAYWGWIHFKDNSDPNSTIRNAIIRYGGFLGNSWRAPIRIQNISPTLEFISFEHNHRNAVQIIGGNWTSNVLESTSIVYWLYDNHLTVLAGNTLAIAPGVRIKPAPGHMIVVRGTLNATGNASQPIVITSENDDTICGTGMGGEKFCDTNNNGTDTVPSAGDWGWIEFAEESNPQSRIQNAVFRYGGRVGAWHASIMLFSASPHIERVEFDSNHTAINFYDNAAPTLGCNDIINSVNNGMYNHNPANVVNAENQWWGAASGPTHPSNPGGSGASVNDGIDFAPWSSNRCTNFSP